MKHSIFALFIFCLLIPFACKKEIQDPSLQDRLQGSWQSTPIPKAVYTFRADTMEIDAQGGYHETYVFSVEGSDICLTNIDNGYQLSWTITFSGPDTAFFDGHTKLIPIKAVRL